MGFLISQNESHTTMPVLFWSSGLSFITSSSAEILLEKEINSERRISEKRKLSLSLKHIQTIRTQLFLDFYEVAENSNQQQRKHGTLNQRVHINMLLG